MQVLAAQVAAVALAGGSVTLAVQCWRQWRRTGLSILAAMAFFFSAYGTYRCFWVWYHFSGQPREWASGWHVNGMLWAIAVGIVVLCWCTRRKGH